MASMACAFGLPQFSLLLPRPALSYQSPFSTFPFCFLCSSSKTHQNQPLYDTETDQFRRQNLLKKVDEELAKGHDEEALSIIFMLQGSPNGLRGFGAASQVPQRIYSLEELRMNKIEASKLLSPVDRTLGGVRKTLQIAAAFSGILAWQTLGLNEFQVLFILLTFTLLSGIDLFLNGGGIEALILDTLGRILSQKYRDRVSKHEAGHFLVAYLLGVLPKSYTLSSLDAFKKSGSLNIQAGTTFVDFQFQEEVKSGKLSSGTLNIYSCIALAGVSAEYLLFGLAEGGLADIQQLDSLLKSLSFTQKKADSQVRWAVLNTITLLRRHAKVHEKLTRAMVSGNSVGTCIEVIEGALDGISDI